MTEEPSHYAAFISYASRDRDKADQICASLVSKGMRCWIAPRDVRAGHEYGAEIIRGIERSRCLVLLLSEAANQSPHVRNEVERAVSKRKPVFPVRVEEVMPSPSLELFVSASHWIDAWTGRLVDHVDRLAHDLGDDSVMEQATQATEQARRRRQVPRWLVAGVSFAALVLAIMLGNHLSSRFNSPSAPTPAPTPAPAVRDEPRPSTSGPPTAFVVPSVPPAAAAADPGRLALGVDPSTIGRDDLKPVIEANPARGGIALKIEMPANLRNAVLAGARLQYALDDEGFERVRRGTTEIAPDPRKLAAASQLRLQIEFRDGQMVGPFTYALDGRSALQEASRQRVLAQKAWVHVMDKWVMFTHLGHLASAVKAVHLGESPDALDMTMEVRPSGAGAEEYAAHGISYQAGIMPVRPGARVLYTQLEFLDGTRSEVRKVEVRNQPEGPYRTSGLRLKLVEGPEDTAAPVVFAAFWGVRGKLQVLASRPANASKAYYAVDGGSLADAGGQESPHQGPQGVELLIPMPRESVSLEYRLQDGRRLGPFTYAIGDPEALIVEGLRVHFDEPPVGWVRCARVPFELPLPGVEPGEAPADMEARSAWQRRLDEDFHVRQRFGMRLAFDLGLGFLNDAAITPAVVCYASPTTQGMTQRHWPAWAAVKEVRVGTQPGKLDKTVPIELTPQDVARDPQAAHKYAWHVALPVDTQAVFVRLIYRDGAESEEMRLVPEEIEAPELFRPEA